MNCSTFQPRTRPSHGRVAALPVVAAISVTTAALMFFPAGTAAAATPRVGLGIAKSFAVLGGSTVTNTGPSSISGDLGVAPGTAVTGFPPGQVKNGVVHAADAVAQQAQADLTTAFNDAAGRTPPTAVPVELGGKTLAPGVYKASTELGLTGTLTLDARSDPDAVFIFQAGSTLTTASSSRVNLIGGAQPCNVFWQVGSSATLGTQTAFVGTVMALASITAQTRATVSGRLLARNGQVSLDTNTITRPACSSPTKTSPSSPVTTTPAPTDTPTTTSPAGSPGLVVPVPVIPGLPAIPGLPTAITIPPLPGLPGTPPSSDRPVVPTAPRTPVIPGSPVSPNSPNSPLVPAAPGQPGQPTTSTPGMSQGNSDQSSTGGQITEVPRGAVDTGDGSTATTHDQMATDGLGLGLTAAAGALGVAVRLRRR